MVHGLTSQSLVTAQADRFPGCDQCEVDAGISHTYCASVADVAFAIALPACAGAGPAAPICAAIASGVYASARTACAGKLAYDLARCWWPDVGPCCPVFCELGHCCAAGEKCIPYGCCPEGRVVCAG